VREAEERRKAEEAIGKQKKYDVELAKITAAAGGEC